MNYLKLPCFYYPTTVAVIDDDLIFLENLTPNLSSKIPYQLFDNPTDALNSLLALKGEFPTSHDYLHRSGLSEEFTLFDQHAVNISFFDIHNKLYDKKRFVIPSVVIVDHDMPEMNGIEFCKRLIDFPIKKIMLTGVADHRTAIDAFNNGIIHKYIMKDDPNVFEFIDQAILEMQQNYFTGLSELIIRNIAASAFSYLEDKQFIAFFIDLIAKHSIIEFYLIDPVGSFLLVNTEGKILWLIVKSEANIHDEYLIAKDQNAPDDTIMALANRQNLLFLFSEEDYRQPVEKWFSYLHPASEIEGLQGCFYTLVEGKNANKVAGILKEDIFTYNKYLRLNN